MTRVVVNITRDTDREKVVLNFCCSIWTVCTRPADYYDEEEEEEAVVWTVWRGVCLFVLLETVRERKRMKQSFRPPSNSSIKKHFFIWPASAHHHYGKI